MIQCLSRPPDGFSKFRDDFDLLGKHLSHAQSSFQQFVQKLLSADANRELVEIPLYDRKTG
jgi:DNA anti-recombination protein RmuC